MKKRLISVFAFALAVSAGAAFVLYQLISTRVTAGAAATRPATQTVFVAAHDLQPGALVTEKDVVKEEFLKVPDGVVAKKEDIVNRGVITAIHKDAPFFTGTLTGAGEGAGFATTIPKGMRAFTIKVNEVVGVAGFAVAGMHVDVLVAGTPPSAGQAGAISRTLLQNITVLSAGQNYQKDAEGKPVLVQVVNLLVTPTQAEILNLATDQRIQLVLRNPDDQAVIETPGAQTISLFGVKAAPSPKPAHASEPSIPKVPVVAAVVPAPVAPPVVAPRNTSVIEVLSGNTRTQVTVRKLAIRDSTEAVQ